MVRALFCTVSVTSETSEYGTWMLPRCSMGELVLVLELLLGVELPVSAGMAGCSRERCTADYGTGMEQRQARRSTLHFCAASHFMQSPTRSLVAAGRAVRQFGKTPAALIAREKVREIEGRAIRRIRQELQTVSANDGPQDSVLYCASSVEKLAAKQHLRGTSQRE